MNMCSLGNTRYSATYVLPKRHGDLGTLGWHNRLSLISASRNLPRQKWGSSSYGMRGYLALAFAFPVPAPRPSFLSIDFMAVLGG